MHLSFKYAQQQWLRCRSSNRGHSCRIYEFASGNTKIRSTSDKFTKRQRKKLVVNSSALQRSPFVCQSTEKYYSTLTKGKPSEAVQVCVLCKCAVAKKQICFSSNQIAQLSNAAGLGQEANSTSHKLRNSLELFVADRWLNPVLMSTITISHFSAYSIKPWQQQHATAQAARN